MSPAPLVIHPICLAGRHVRLEPLSLDHVDALCEVGLDESVWRYITHPVTSRDDMAEYVGAALAEAERGSAQPFVTRSVADDRIVGSTRYGSIDPANRRVEIGWTWVAPRWQRTAVNTEAKYLMLRHAFEVLSCHRVELKTDATNARSRAAIERLGATYEGCLRKHMVAANGRFRDTAYFSILDEEWRGVRTRIEAMLTPAP
jgi:RimJ/RimL family protein N-acetyltransferase